MQFILTFISALFAALFVRAAPAAIGSLAMRDDGSCNTGSAVCCNSVSSPDNLNNGTVSLLGALGVNVDNLLNNIGIGCSALVGGISCDSNAVCCNDNDYNGAVALDCIPIGVNL